MLIEDIQGIEKICDDKLKQAKDYSNAIASGIDQYTGKKIYVDCRISDDITFRMNAGMLAANKLDMGIRLAQTNNETTTIIVDFNDDEFIDIPIETALQINRLQSLDARIHYLEYQQLKNNIKQTKQDGDIVALRNIPIIFSNVKTLP